MKAMESMRSSKTLMRMTPFDSWIEKNRMFDPACLTIPPFTDFSAKSNVVHNIASPQQHESQSDTGKARLRWSEFKYWMHGATQGELRDVWDGLLCYILFLGIKERWWELEDFVTPKSPTSPRLRRDKLDSIQLISWTSRNY